MTRKIDMVGKKFGRLTVLQDLGYYKGNTWYLCRCECSNVVEVRGISLRNGDCKSCGCLRKETASKVNTKHGHSNERAFNVWRSMITRCYNSKHGAYEKYGGRGIKVCDEWLNDYTKFRDFLYANGYDENAPFGECTIDRIDNNKGYSPENCRIVSMKEQALNKSSNHIIEYVEEEKVTLTEKAKSSGLTSHQVSNRLNKGWDLQRALETPLTQDKTYTVNNETHTISEWAQIMGVTDAVIRGRLRTQSIEKIYDEWKEKGKLEVGDFTVKLEEANGEKHPRIYWAELIGISDKTLRKLLDDYTMQEIYDDWKVHGGNLTFIRRNKPMEANGEVHSSKEWCEILHISPKCIRNNLKKMSMQEVYDKFKNRIEK